jgi:sulfur carrier protein
MPDSLNLQLNGQNRSFPQLGPQTTLDILIEALALKSDRIAVEHNGEIKPRAGWGTVTVSNGDRLEIVHFVGGGNP